MEKPIRNYMLVGALLAGLVGGTLGVNEYFAKASELQLVSRRLEQKILSDKRDYIQRRIWMIEQHYGPGCQTCPAPMRSEYQALQMELQSLDRQLRGS